MEDHHCYKEANCKRLQSFEKKTGNDVTGKEPEESLEERSGQGANFSMVSGHSRAL